jgi:hypothetical protein
MNTIIHPGELLLLKNAAPLIGIIRNDAGFQINNFVYKKILENKTGSLLLFIKKFRKVIYLIHELYTSKSLVASTVTSTIATPLADIAIGIIKVIKWILLFFVFLLLLALVAAIFEGIYTLEMNPLLMVLIIAAIPVSFIAMYTFFMAIIVNKQTEFSADSLSETISETVFV